VNNSMQFKARIRNIATASNIPAQVVLQSYMLERLLERIASSKYKDKFILKGGMLIASIVGIESRTTMDMDTTVRDLALSEIALQKILVEICEISLRDNVVLTVEGMEPIRDDDEYGGFRATLNAVYETIRTPLKMDITTGDVITPGAIHHILSSKVDGKTIQILAYNIETVLAEKVETILRRSVLNTRPRDFYDVFILTKTQFFDRGVFTLALKSTAERRSSLAELENRSVILGKIQVDPSMRQRWDRYARDNHYAREISFDDVMAELQSLIL